MYKKSLILTVGLCAAMLAACQPDPTQISSTQHQHPNQSSDVHSANSNGNIHSETRDTSHNATTEDAMNHTTLKSAPNAAAQPFDLQFLDTMIAHHESAIEMAKAAGTKSQNAELKSFAAKIVSDQEKEITEMKKWREQWFAGKPSALNMEMAGMADSMKGMDMTKMSAATGAAFDLKFVNQMTTHHQGAVVMAREALTKAEHAEIKMLANQIIAAQEAEIKLMQTWKTQWAK